jgi:tripartite ATP-independent transporter DctM subunit
MLQAVRATWDARWELVLPFIPIVLIVGGYTLPVPAAAITASYALFIAVAVRRELKLDRKLARIVIECGLLVGGVLLIFGTAMGLTNFLITEHVPDRMATWIGSVIEQRWVFLLALNAFLLVVGCLIDIFSAIVVVAPLVVPAALAFGIDPVHLGIVFLANLELGYLTPPIGLNLFMSAYRFKVPVMEVARAALPVLCILLVGVLAITYVPLLTTWLPAWWRAG